MGLLNNWYSIDTGFTNVSAISFDEIDAFYGTYTLKDFEERYESSIGYSRDVWKLTYPSIQNPVALSASNGTIQSVITVQDTTHFPPSGYLYHTNGSDFGIIQYTGKTSNTFTGCTVYSGSSSIYTGSQIIPYSI